MNWKAVEDWLLSALSAVFLSTLIVGLSCASAVMIHEAVYYTTHLSK